MLRLVLSALRHRRGAALALGALAMLAVAAAVAVPLYTSAADSYAVQTELRHASAAERSVTVTAEIAVPDGVDQALTKLVGQVRAQAPQPELEEITGVLVRGWALRADGADRVDAPLATRTEVCEHLEIVGRCPDSAAEVVMSGPTARRLGIDAPGATLDYRIPGLEEPVQLTVVGLYEPPTDSSTVTYWAGRVELAPEPLRASNPIFTPMATFDQVEVARIFGTVDLVIPAAPVDPDDLGSYAVDLEKTAIDTGFNVVNGLPKLIKSIDATRTRLRISAPLGGLMLLGLAWCILLLAAAHTARERRAEIALSVLRGAPARHRFLLTLGPTLLVLLLAAPFGVGLGWLMIRWLTWATFTPPGPLPLTAAAGVAGTIALLLAMVSVVVAERFIHTGPLLDALRRVPSRLRRTGVVVELTVLVLAVAAVIQSLADGSGGGVALVAPVLAAAAVGLLAARLVRPIAAVIGAAQLRRGSLPTGLAALQLARRPGAGPVVTLVVVSLALLGYTVAAWDAAGRLADHRAAAELGAQQVVTVAAVSRPALLASVRSADPDGDWALAAVRARLDRGRSLLAVDTTRLATVLPDGGGELAALAPQLRPRVNPPIQVEGAELVLDIAVRSPIVNGIPITIVLSGPKGEPVRATVEVTPEVGRRSYRAAIPTCAQAPGCRLAWLSFPWSPDELRFYGISQAGPERDLVVGREMRAAIRWRPAFVQDREVTLGGADGYLTLIYRPEDPRRVSRDIRLQVADSAAPLPVAAAGDLSLPHTQQLTEASILAGGSRPVTVVRAAPALVGVEPDGVVADLEYADRLSDTLDNNAQLQVWLGPAAPADAVQRLEQAGLTLIRTETVQDRADRYRSYGDGLGLRLQLVAVVLAVALVMLAMLVLGSTDRRHRAAELAALRDQGIPAAVVRKVANRSYLVAVVAALPVAIATGALLWWLAGASRAATGAAAVVAPPDLSWISAGLALVAGSAILIGTAWYAGRRLHRAAAAGAHLGEAGR